MEKAIEWIYLETHFDEPRSMVIRKTLEFKKTAKTGGIRYSVMRKKLECIHTLIMGGVFSSKLCVLRICALVVWLARIYAK